MNKKSQIFATELIVVMLLFLSLFFIAVIIWDSKIYEFNQNIVSNDIRLGSANFAETLVTNPGKPYNWNITNIEQLGLADDYYYINNEKLDNFFYLCLNNYSLIQEMMGIPEYDFYVIIEDMSDNVVRSFNPYTPYSRSALWQENVFINNTAYKMKIGVVI